LGGAVGLIFAYWGKIALTALTDQNRGLLPKDVDLSLNWRALAFTFGVSLLTGALFGLAPALRATNPDLAPSLKQSGRAASAMSRLGRGLIVAQVAISLLLLIGAGLFIRTLNKLQSVNPGFNVENLLLFRLQPQQGGYKDEQLLQFYERLLERLDSLPGVRAATFAKVPLVADDNWFNGILLPGEPDNASTSHSTTRQMARENYLEVMEIPLLRGRVFTEHDDQRAPGVAIVNLEFGRRFFPNEELLGKRVRFRRDKREVEIIGVVADTRYENLRQETRPLLYTPWRQEVANIGYMHFALRATGDPTALVASARQAVRELDTNLPITMVSTQAASLQATLGQERMYARILSFFGALALLLAAIGLSGVLAYSVAQRVNEIGIRMALGARPIDVLRLVTWQGMKLALLGLAAGAIGCYGLTRLLAGGYFARNSWQTEMANRLYGVEGTDPVTFVAVASVLAIVALIACWLPARRAAKVDPIKALRHQ
jgi:predicted permease